MSAVSGSGISVGAADQAFSLAEEQTGTINVEVQPEARGNVSANLSSNDFFDPNVSTVVATGVAPVAQTLLTPTARGRQVNRRPSIC